MKKIVYVLVLQFLLTFSSYVKAVDVTKLQLIDVPAQGIFIEESLLNKASKHKDDIKRFVNVIEVSFSNDVYYMTFTEPNRNGKTVIVKLELSKRKDGCFYETIISEEYKEDNVFSLVSVNFKTYDLSERTVVCFNRELLNYGKYKNVIMRSHGSSTATFVEVNANGSQVQH